jgi:hypothetical protein
MNLESLLFLFNMFTKSFSFFLSFLFSNLLIGTVLAQQSRIKIIDRLLACRQQVPQITSVDLSHLSYPSSGMFLDNRRYLIKTASDLYMGVEGTGMLYKILPQGDSLSFERIDQTMYAGSNFFAAYFTLDNRLFNFGGYGFWRTNGSLRVFNLNNREWDIIPLRSEMENVFSSKSSGVYWREGIRIPGHAELKSISSYPALFWVDRQNQRLVTLGHRVVNETQYSSNSFLPIISELDIRTGFWKELGRLKRYGWNNYISVPWGLLINESGSEIYLANISANRIMMPDSLLRLDLRKLYSGSEPSVLYAIDSTIYFGNINSNTIDSVKLSSSRFINTGIPIYEREGFTKLSLERILVYSVIFLLILILLGVMWFRKKVKVADSSLSRAIDTIQEIQPDSTKEILNEVEKGLIQLLYEKSLNGSAASVDDLNKVLGVSAKPEAIKRKVRSEVLKAINVKWGLLTGSSEKLILFSRSTLDKRSREYFIKKKNISNPFILKVVNLSQ